MSTDQLIAPWIQTLDGRAFDFEDMSLNTFDAQEVAIVLSRIPRFVGHSRWTYTVAQHCVLMERNTFGYVSKLCALLHDVPEVFTGDISAPLKAWLRQYGGTNALSQLESRIWKWLADYHQLPEMSVMWLRELDLQALATEQRDLMEKPPRPWIELPKPWKERIEPWSQEYARDEWLNTYLENIP